MIKLRNFSGGINTYQDATQIPITSATYIENADISSGVIKSLPKYTKIDYNTIKNKIYTVDYLITNKDGKTTLVPKTMKTNLTKDSLKVEFDNFISEINIHNIKYILFTSQPCSLVHYGNYIYVTEENRNSIYIISQEEYKDNKIEKSDTLQIFNTDQLNVNKMKLSFDRLIAADIYKKDKSMYDKYSYSNTFREKVLNTSYYGYAGLYAVSDIELQKVNTDFFKGVSDWPDDALQKVGLTKNTDRSVDLPPGSTEYKKQITEYKIEQSDKDEPKLVIVKQTKIYWYALLAGVDRQYRISGDIRASSVGTQNYPTREDFKLIEEYFTENFVVSVTYDESYIVRDSVIRTNYALVYVTSTKNEIKINYWTVEESKNIKVDKLNFEIGVITDWQFFGTFAVYKQSSSNSSNWIKIKEEALIFKPTRILPWNKPITSMLYNSLEFFAVDSKYITKTTFTVDLNKIENTTEIVPDWGQIYDKTYSYGNIPISISSKQASILKYPDQAVILESSELEKVYNDQSWTVFPYKLTHVSNIEIYVTLYSKIFEIEQRIQNNIPIHLKDNTPIQSIVLDITLPFPIENYSDDVFIRAYKVEPGKQDSKSDVLLCEIPIQKIEFINNETAKIQFLYLIEKKVKSLTYNSINWLNRELPPENLRYLTEWQNYFIGAVNNILYYSIKNDPTKWLKTNRQEFSENITGILSLFNYILIFTKNTTHLVYIDNRTQILTIKQLSSQIGCESHYTAKIFENAPIWMGNKDIIYTLSGQYIKPVTNKSLSTLFPSKEKIVHTIDKDNASFVANFYYALIKDRHYYLIQAYRDSEYFLSHKLLDLDFTTDLKITYKSINYDIVTKNEKRIFFMYNTILHYYNNNSLEDIFTSINTHKIDKDSLGYRTGKITEYTPTEIKNYNHFYILFTGYLTVDIFINNIKVLNRQIIGEIDSNEIKRADITVPAELQRGYFCELAFYGQGTIYGIDIDSRKVADGRNF